MVRGCDSDDEDDEYLFRYPLPNSSSSSSSSSKYTTTTTISTPSAKKGNSGGLAPSKSTVYVSNLDYTLTNSDIHTLFSTFGKVARVTVLKSRTSARLSRGVAFVLFVSRDDALAAARSMDGKILNGRTLSASIATDNGRAAEFIRRRVYKDKSRCYECGEEGHLSYDCPRNQLGPREKPEPKRFRRGAGQREGGAGGGEVEDGVGGGEESVDFEDDNWASVVDTRGVGERMMRGDVKDDGRNVGKQLNAKKAGYFSDESGEDD